MGMQRASALFLWRKAELGWKEKTLLANLLRRTSPEDVVCGLMPQTVGYIIIRRTDLATRTLGQEICCYEMGQKDEQGLRTSRIVLPPGSAVGRRCFPKTVVRGGMVLLAVGGVFVVVTAVLVADLNHPTSRPTLVMMVGNERQQQYHDHGKRHAECTDGILHGAKIAKAFCKRVAFWRFRRKDKASIAKITKNPRSRPSSEASGEFILDCYEKARGIRRDPKC